MRLLKQRGSDEARVCDQTHESERKRKIDRTFSYTLRIFYIIIGVRCIFAKKEGIGKI